MEPAHFFSLFFHKEGTDFSSHQRSCKVWFWGSFVASGARMGPCSMSWRFGRWFLPTDGQIHRSWEESVFPEGISIGFLLEIACPKLFLIQFTTNNHGKRIHQTSRITYLGGNELCFQQSFSITGISKCNFKNCFCIFLLFSASPPLSPRGPDRNAQGRKISVPWNGEIRPCLLPHTELAPFFFLKNWRRKWSCPKTMDWIEHTQILLTCKAKHWGKKPPEPPKKNPKKSLINIFSALFNSYQQISLQICFCDEPSLLGAAFVSRFPKSKQANKTTPCQQSRAPALSRAIPIPTQGKLQYLTSTTS